MNPIIHIGIFTNHVVKGWEKKAIDLISQHEFVSSVIFFSLPAEKKKARPFRAYHLFQAFEKAWFKPKEDALEEFILTDIYENSIITEVHDLEKNVSSKQIDILINFTGSSVFYTNLQHFFSLGILNIRFGKTGIHALPACFWEVMKGCKSCSAELYFQKKDGTIVWLQRYSVATVPFSVRNSLNQLCWKLSEVFRQKLTELQTTGMEVFLQNQQIVLKNVTQYHEKFPKSSLMIWLFAKNILGYLKYKYHLLFRQPIFFLLFKRENYTGQDIILNSFKKIFPPGGYFWADPFIVRHHNEHLIFFEDFSHSKNKAHISLLKIHDDDSVSSPVRILEKSYHLSYPFILQQGNDFFMIPETTSNHSVEIYRAKQFPYQWEFEMKLFEDVELFDVTIAFHHNKYWMFATTVQPETRATNDSLLLFYSNELLTTNWTPHPKNPVVTEVNNCRPAGKIFSKDDRLYRPAQNNASFQYGHAMNINEIIVINEFDYREKIVQRIAPDESDSFVACHTFNHEKGLIILDAATRKKG